MEIQETSEYMVVYGWAILAMSALLGSFYALHIFP